MYWIYPKIPDATGEGLRVREYPEPFFKDVIIIFGTDGIYNHFLRNLYLNTNLLGESSNLVSGE